MKYKLSICSIFIALGLGVISACAQTGRETAADNRAIRQLIEQHASSARRDDVGGMIATMHEDVVARLDDGRFLVGRDANASFYRGITTGGPQRLAHRHPPQSIRVRFLAPDMAFVDVDSASVSDSRARTPYFLVVTKVDGKWGVAEVRNGPSYERAD